MTTFEITMALVAAVQTIAICVLYQIHMQSNKLMRDSDRELKCLITDIIGVLHRAFSGISGRTNEAEKNIESLKDNHSLLLQLISRLSDAVNAIKKRRK